jgi:hypothetical protein
MKRVLVAVAFALAVSSAGAGTAFAADPADPTGDSVEAPKKNQLCIDLEWFGVPKELTCIEWPL